MIAQHPTETASDGRRIDQSHYISKADNLDDMIECAMCGFLVDLTKRPTGDSFGAIPEGSATPLTGSGVPRAPGIPFTDQYAESVDTNSGCPFCNSLNPFAVGRGRTGFERPKKSLENL